MDPGNVTNRLDTDNFPNQLSKHPLSFADRLFEAFQIFPLTKFHSKYPASRQLKRKKQAFEDNN